MVQPSALERAASIADAGSRIAKQCQAMVFLAKREKNVRVLQVDVLVSRIFNRVAQVESQDLAIETRLGGYVT